MPALAAGSTAIDAKTVAAELAKVLCVRRDSAGDGAEDDEVTGTSTCSRYAYVRFAVKHPGRTTFKERESMVQARCAAGCPTGDSGPVVGQFISRAWLSQHPMKSDAHVRREMRTLATSLGLSAGARA